MYNFAGVAGSRKLHTGARKQFDAKLTTTTNGYFR